MTGTFPLLPSPVSLQVQQGTVHIPRSGQVRMPFLPGERQRLLFLGQQLTRDLAAAGAPNWQVVLSPDTSALPSESIIDIHIDAQLPSQGYSMAIRPDASAVRTSPAQNSVPFCTPFCVLTASDFDGLRNGIQTIRQLIRTGGTIPALNIYDKPSLKVRAYSLDISRGRVPTLLCLRELIDLLELCKYNQLQLYVESSVAFHATREAWEDDSPLTFADIRRLDDWCWLRGIEFVPQMASFGHLYDLCRTRKWRYLSEHPEQADRPFSFVERMLHHTLNPTLAESRNFICDRIDEYAPLFRSRYFNITADETFDLCTGESAQTTESKTVNDSKTVDELGAANERETAIASGTASDSDKVSVPQLYADFIQQICTHLRRHGRTPIMYADMSITYPQLLPQIPEDVIFANWDYREHPSEENVGLVAYSGHAQLLCPGVQTWNRLLPDGEAAWSNISRMAQYARKHHALGLLVTDWGDYGHVNDPLMSRLGIGYGAQFAWAKDVGRTGNPAGIARLGDRTSEIRESPESIGKLRKPGTLTDLTSKEDVDRAISVLLLHDPTGTMASLLTQAGKLQSFSWADAVQWLELCEQEDAVNGSGHGESHVHGRQACMNGRRIGAHDKHVQANRDVLAVLGPDYANATTCYEARQLFMREREATINRAEQHNAALHTLLERCEHVADSSSNTLLNQHASVLQLMIEGQILLNRLGCTLQKFTDDHSDWTADIPLAHDRQYVDFRQQSALSTTDSTTDTALAHDIERWVTRYSMRWNQVSRPSQLWRIQEVLWSFADLLRNGMEDIYLNELSSAPTRDGDTSAVSADLVISTDPRESLTQGSGRSTSWRHLGVMEIPWKINGRHQSPLTSDMERDGLCLYWPASGFEVDFRGPELWCEIETHFSVYEQWVAVEVNGEPICRMPLQSGLNHIPLVRGFAEDQVSHIRVLKEVQAMRDDPAAEFILHGLSYPHGKLLPPPRHELCFEFVGDSITSGAGAVGSRRQKSYCAQIFSAENSFPRMVADAFDANFRVISHAGWGIVCNFDNDPTCTLPSIYERTCALATSIRARQQGAGNPADFTSEPADAVIINLGTNDASAFTTPRWKRDSSGNGKMGPSDYESFKLTVNASGQPDVASSKILHDGTVDFLKMVRKHNPRAAILWCYGMMGDFLTPLLKRAVRNYREETADMNVYFVQLPDCIPHELGSFDHPSREGHEKAAQVLEETLHHIFGRTSGQPFGRTVVGDSRPSEATGHLAHADGHFS